MFWLRNKENSVSPDPSPNCLQRLSAADKFNASRANHPNFIVYKVYQHLSSVIFMPSSLQMLRGHTAFNRFVHPSFCLSVHHAYLLGRKSLNYMTKRLQS